MELGIGKQYEVRLSSKQQHSVILGKIVGVRLDEGDCSVEFIKPIKWNGLNQTLRFNEYMKERYGQGIVYLVGIEQVLKEVK